MYGKIRSRCHVRSKSADFAIYRIWALHCFLEWVFALQAALMVFGNIEKPYTVASGSRSRLPWAVSVVHLVIYFLTLQLSGASGTFFRAKLMPDLESAPTNRLYMNHHVSKSSKVILGHMRSLTSDDLGWPNFLVRSTSGCFEVF